MGEVMLPGARKGVLAAAEPATHWHEGRDVVGLPGTWMLLCAGVVSEFIVGVLLFLIEGYFVTYGTLLIPSPLLPSRVRIQASFISEIMNV